MYGVPQNLDIAFLHGASVIQVCLSQHQIQLHFHPVGSISIEGRWELHDANDFRIDRSHDTPNRPPYQLHRLLGQHVAATEVAAPGSFSLRFETGELLRVFDDSKQFESFSIQPGDIFV